MPVSAPACRVCHGDGAVDVLIDPCLCIGTVRWIHAGCLDQWRGRSSRLQNSVRCELCGLAYRPLQRPATRLEAACRHVLRLLLTLGVLALFGALIGFATSPMVGLVSALAFVGLCAVVDVILLLMSFSKGSSQRGVFGAFVHQLRTGSLERESTPRSSGICRGGGLQKAGVLSPTGPCRPASLLEYLGEATADGTLRDAPPVERRVDAASPALEARPLSQHLLGVLRRRELLWMLPLLLPEVVTQLLFLLRGLLGPTGLISLGLLLARLGAVYALLLLPVSLAAVLLRPPEVAVRSHYGSGLPLVRSLTEAEREALATCRRR